MAGKSEGKSTLYVRQLGAHHFAYLRAVANGFSVIDAAKRYLGIEHGAAATTAHRSVVDHLQGVARRRGDKDWRLVGLVIGTSSPADRPDLDTWAADAGLDGWSEAELQEMYAEAFPIDRKEGRNARLRERQLELLKSLQSYAAQAPKATDLIAGWFDDTTAERLKRNGLLMIGELQAVIARGGRWWGAVQAIGELKARRIESYLQTIGAPAAPVMSTTPAANLARAVQQLDRPAAEFVPPAPSGALPSPAPARPPLSQLDGGGGVNRAPALAAGTAATNDREAIELWIQARAGSIKTATSYRREAERMLLWCVTLRKKPLSSMILEDCLAYMAFLEHIPDEWISRRNVRRFAEGWAPFSGQLLPESRRQAIVVVASMFEWLVTAGYLRMNPWALVNRKTGDNFARRRLESRAFTKEAWATITGFVAAAPPSPSRERTLFLLHFGEATGLRAAELLDSKLGDFELHKGRWALQVLGKGSKLRVISVPRQAVAALEAYLLSRGLPELGHADPSLPLVSSTKDSRAPVTYSPLYKSSKAWFKQALRASDIPLAERMSAMKASLHWLRHTCGTRAVERGMPLNDLAGQLGHSDPRMTMRYARTQLEELQDRMESAFGG